MIDYSKFIEYCRECGLQNFVKNMPRQIVHNLDPQVNRDLAEWQIILGQLPVCKPEHIDFNSDAICIGSADDLPQDAVLNLRRLLMELSPWRKGPFNLFGIFINTEWRSDMKWQRLEKHIQQLDNRLVLDIGCGNGYHVLRMAGKQARAVIGIDPYIRSVLQFHALHHFIRQDSMSLHSPLPHTPILL